jgi:hypothetical protein
MNTSKRRIDSSMCEHFISRDDNRPSMHFTAQGEKACQAVEKQPRLLVWYCY